MKNVVKITTESNIIMSFGRYKGKTIEQIKEIDETYLQWLLTAERIPHKLRMEVERVLDLPYETDEKEYVLNFLEKKVEDHKIKYPTLDGERLFNWIMSKPWAFKYRACLMDVSEINEKRRKSESIKRLYNKD
jgi:uncharacterized protein (DUF3820 family)